jgi:hypothetical protein
MDNKKLDIWKARIEEIETSGDSMKGYCRRKNLNCDEGYYWKKKIRNIDQSEFLPEKERLTEVVFAPEEKGTSGLKVSFGNGIEIIPEKGFNEYEFLRVVSLVRSL